MQNIFLRDCSNFYSIIFTIKHILLTCHRSTCGEKCVDAKIDLVIYANEMLHSLFQTSLICKDLYLFRHFIMQITALESLDVFLQFINNRLTIERSGKSRSLYLYLFVFFQIAQTRKLPVAELARIGGGGIGAIGIDVGVDLGLRRETRRRRSRAGRRCLAAATWIGPAILAVPRGTSGS